MKTSVRASNSQFAGYLQRRGTSDQLPSNPAWVCARAHFINKTIRLEGTRTQTVFDLRADSEPGKGRLALSKVQRGHRIPNLSKRLKNERFLLSASTPGARTRKIVESRWWGESSGRADKSADLFRRLSERLAMHTAYDAHRRKIRAMADLPEGWDTYSAKPPGEAAIHLALQFVDLLEKRRLSIAWIAPTSDDSIMVVLDTGVVRQEWEFYGDGDTAVMIQKAGGEKQYFDLDASKFASHLPR